MTCGRFSFPYHNFMKDNFSSFHGAVLLAVLLSVLSPSSLASTGCEHQDSKEVHIARSREGGSVVKVNY